MTELTNKEEIKLNKLKNDFLKTPICKQIDIDTHTECIVKFMDMDPEFDKKSLEYEIYKERVNKAFPDYLKEQDPKLYAKYMKRSKELNTIFAKINCIESDELPF